MDQPISFFFSRQFHTRALRCYRPFSPTFSSFISAAATTTAVASSAYPALLLHSITLLYYFQLLYRIPSRTTHQLHYHRARRRQSCVLSLHHSPPISNPVTNHHHHYLPPSSPPPATHLYYAHHFTSFTNRQPSSPLPSVTTTTTNINHQQLITGCSPLRNHHHHAAIRRCTRTRRATAQQISIYYLSPPFSTSCYPPCQLSVGNRSTSNSNWLSAPFHFHRRRQFFQAQALALYQPSAFNSPLSHTHWRSGHRPSHRICKSHHHYHQLLYPSIYRQWAFIPIINFQLIPDHHHIIVALTHQQPPLSIIAITKYYPTTHHPLFTIIGSAPDYYQLAIPHISYR